MKPICLRFQAFGPFAKEEVIDFNALRENKLFLISGETGSGKTTILEAITYALYGKSTGGKRGDLLAMRCQYARQEQPTEIEFTFEVQGRTYRFVRQIAFARKNYHISQNAMILEDGIFKPLFENPTQGNINREAEKIIGLTYEQFVKVIILPQGQFEQFLVADSKEKEMILVSLFKAEKWQKAANFLFDMLLSQKKELEEKRIRMDASLKEYECENIEKLKAAIMEREQKIEQLKHTIQKYDNWLLDNEESYQKYAAFVKAKEEFLQKTEQLEQDRIRLQKRVREKKECFDTLLGETDKWERVKEESIALKALEPVYKKIALLEEEKRKYGEECKKLLRQKEQAQKEKKAREEACLLSQIEERNLYKEYSDAFANYIQNIAGYLAEKLEEDKPCPVCGSTHHPMKAECHEKSVSKEQLDEIRQKMEEAKELVEQRNQEKTAAEEKLRESENLLLEKTVVFKNCQKEYEESLLNCREGILNVAELNRVIARKEESYSKYLRELKNAEEEAGKAGQELLRTEQEMELQQNHWKRMESEMEAFEETESGKEIDEWKAEIAEIKGQKRKEENLCAVLISEKEKMQRRSRQLEKELPKVERQIEETENNLAFAKRLRGDTGVGLQRYVLGVMLSSITAEANRMLEHVHGGRYHIYRTIESSGNTRKAGLELEVMDAYSGMKRSVSSLSGGEKFLVAISLAIGLSTVVQAQNGGIRIEALFIDEGFGSLDKQSIQDALEVLGMIHQRTNSMIGIISHVDLLKENIPMQLQIQKTKEGSYIWNKSTFM